MRYLAVIFLGLLSASVANATLFVKPNAVDVRIPISITNLSNGSPYTGLTVTNFDLYYHVGGAAISAKVDATSGSATVHADNTAVEIGLGEYDICWPDAIWANRSPGTIITLTVVYNGTNVVADRVQISSIEDNASAAKTAAEKIDTSTELRTLLTGSDTAVAKEASLAAIGPATEAEVFGHTFTALGMTFEDIVETWLFSHDGSHDGDK